MTDESGRPEEPREAARPPGSDRGRRRAEVFGDVLPDGTRDERADGWSERDPSDEAGDDWLRRQVPPHHG